MSFVSIHPQSLPLAPSRPLALSLRTTTLLISALAAVLYFFHITRFGITTDEAHSYITATSTQPLFTQLQLDTNPPFYFLLLKSWITLFGTSLLALRSLSAILTLAQIPLIAHLARLCGATNRTTLYALLLTAFNPLQLFYAQDARNYALSIVLLLLGLISFLHAKNSRSIFPWLLHAATIALAAYTHFLLIPITLAYWLAAPFLKLSPQNLLRLAGAHLLAAVLTLPLLSLLVHQLHSSNGTEWIGQYWSAISHSLAVPTSLELLPFGSQMPPYISVFALTPLLRILALAIILAAAAAFFWPRKSAKLLTDAEHEFSCDRWLLLSFTLWPLLFLLLYSLFIKPIYLHGRYDLFAAPAYFLLLAAGFSRIQSFLVARSSCAMPSGGGGAGAPLGMRRMMNTVSPILIPGALALLLTAAISNRFLYPIDPANQRHSDRADYLATCLRPGDTIICTGLEAAPTQFELDQLHLNAHIITFPTESLSHIGWFLPDSAIISIHNWPIRAAQTLTTAANSNGTIYICIDRDAWDPTPAGFISMPRQSLTETLLQAAAHLGYRRAQSNPTDQTKENDLRLLSFAAPR